MPEFGRLNRAPHTESVREPSLRDVRSVLERLTPPVPEAQELFAQLDEIQAHQNSGNGIPADDVQKKSIEQHLRHIYRRVLGK